MRRWPPNWTAQDLYNALANTYGAKAVGIAIATDTESSPEREQDVNSQSWQIAIFEYVDDKKMFRSLEAIIPIVQAVHFELTNRDIISHPGKYEAKFTCQSCMNDSWPQLHADLHNCIYCGKEDPEWEISVPNVTLVDHNLNL